jgi:hypothetical protein
LRFLDEDDFYLFNLDDLSNSRKTFALPHAPKSDARWIKSDETVSVDKYKIQGGLFYFGSYLPSPCSKNEPSLIDPALPLTKKNEQYSVDAEPCFLEYEELEPSERRIYIQWLAGGRVDQNVPDWAPNLFLFGLERRILGDCKRGIVPKEEQIAIRTEVERILALYDDKKHEETIEKYSLFYQYIELLIADRKLYSFSLPRILRSYNETPPLISVAMGQCVADQKPLPADLMFRWFESGVYFKQTTPYHRCKTEFETLFKKLYQKKYGQGIICKPGKQKLRAEDFQYDYQTTTLGFYVLYPIPDGLTDISHSIPLLHKIDAIGLECLEALTRYSKFLGRERPAVERRFGFILLPLELWPANALDASRLITSEEEREALLKAVKLLKKDTAEHQLQVIKYFSDVVFANYKTTYEAIHILETLYKTFGFDKTDLYSNLHSAGSNAPINQNEHDGTLMLDKNKIKELRKDSEKISTMLADIFTGDEDVPAADLKVAAAADSNLRSKKNGGKNVGGKIAENPKTGGKKSGKTAAKSVANENKKAAAKRPLNLDARHAEFLLALIKKDLWKKSDLEHLAKANKLMADGAIETINEASFSEFDESLIEEAQVEVGAVYQFNSALVGKVKEMFAA